jgi:hypothetical protein
MTERALIRDYSEYHFRLRFSLLPDRSRCMELPELLAAVAYRQTCESFVELLEALRDSGSIHFLVSEDEENEPADHALNFVFSQEVLYAACV